MSTKAISAIFEKKLKTVLPAMATAYENVAYNPVVGTPYQRARLLINKPNDLTLGRDVTQRQGFFEVMLLYPVGVGRGDAQDRADKLAEVFEAQLLRDGAAEVEIYETPEISSGFVDGDRYVIVVSIPWMSFVYR